jgi:hypothetical protein
MARSRYSRPLTGCKKPKNTTSGASVHAHDVGLAEEIRFVARGTQQQLVDKSIPKLASIGQRHPSRVLNDRDIRQRSRQGEGAVRQLRR